MVTRLQKQQNPGWFKWSSWADCALEAQLLKLKQEGLRSVNSNQYLDETNARLRRQLQQLKADEKELEVRNQELALENRKLEQSMDNFNTAEQSAYSKIRNLELANSTLERKAKDLRADMSQTRAENNKLEAQLERLTKENSKLSQKIASLGIDQETSDSRLSEMKALMRDAQNEAKMLENEEFVLRDELSNARNEIARLNGILALEQDRSSRPRRQGRSGSRSEWFAGGKRCLACSGGKPAANQYRSNHGSSEAGWKCPGHWNEQQRSTLQSERLSTRNDSLLDTDMAQKEELSVLRAELNNLAMQESRISNEMAGLEIPMKCFWPKHLHWKLKMKIC